ncbi:hypothetical protein CDD83_4951 [Cordyceps sp. RAO-2017]|nr:hypothetical protein CDD83_4951 [Cordyceps sp. RAO-2017]
MRFIWQVATVRGAPAQIGEGPVQQGKSEVATSLAPSLKLVPRRTASRGQSPLFPPFRGLVTCLSSPPKSSCLSTSVLLPDDRRLLPSWPSPFLFTDAPRLNGIARANGRTGLGGIRERRSLSAAVPARPPWPRAGRWTKREALFNRLVAQWPIVPARRPGSLNAPSGPPPLVGPTAAAAAAEGRRSSANGEADLGGAR